MAEKTQEEMLAEQKKNCIFCQIIEGKVPSKKAYEDDKIIAIMDIHPAAKGHLLVMSKEHYPIMPLIPPETFKQMFIKATQLTKAIKKATLNPESVTFIANGGVAGQQSPHFLFHIIPRDKGELKNFDLPENNKDQSELFPSMKHNLTLMMKNHLSREGKLNLLDLDADKPKPKPKPKPTTQEQQSEQTKELQEPKEKKVTIFDNDKIEQLAAMIEQNPELKALLINNPEKLKEMVSNNPQFKQLFAGIDINALGEQVRKQYFAQHPEATDSEQVKDETEEVALETNSVEPEELEQTKEQEIREPQVKEQDAVPRAVVLSDKELKEYIDSKDKLKHYLLNDLETLKELIPNHERIRLFFEGTTPEKVKARYEQEEQQPEPNKDAGLDDIANYFDKKY